MSQRPEDEIVDDAPTALAAEVAPLRVTIREAILEVSGRFNDEEHFEERTRAAARAFDAAGETEKAIANHAAADDWKRRAAGLGYALRILTAVEPFEDEIREHIKTLRQKAARKASQPARRRSAGSAS